MQEQTKIELLKIAAELATAAVQDKEVFSPSRKAGDKRDITVLFADCLTQVEKSFSGLGGETK